MKRNTLMALAAVFYAHSSSLGTTDQEKILADDPGDGDKFGAQVAISGDTMAVAAPFYDTATVTDAGAVFVYVRSGTTWSYQATLIASDPESSDDFAGNENDIGRTVAIDGDTIVVGAPNHTTPSPTINPGVVYVFVRSSNMWSEQQKIGGGNDGYQFGSSVDIEGDDLVIGERSATDNSVGTLVGAAYHYTRSSGTWSQNFQFTASTPDIGDFFGHTVAISGDTVVVGAPGYDIGSDANTGAVYVFVDGGSGWSEEDILTADDAAQSDDLASSLDIDGDMVVAGAPGDNITIDSVEHPNAGSAYVFTRSGANWNDEDKLTASDLEANDSLGESVSISGNTVVVGAPSEDNGGQSTGIGAMYVYTESSGDWSELAKYRAADDADDENFAVSVAIDGNTIIAGALNDGTTPTMYGAAYVQYFVTCDEDFNGDCVVNGGDLGLLLANWGNPGATDLNDDGTTDGSDLGLLLAAWGVCT
ncbi:MAG: hypothetical protein ACF8GE_02080 [Phycisphaerales bacterium JB043]